MSMGYDNVYPKPMLPAEPETEHPPNHEPLKVIQPVDPFHNAFYYTVDQQNNMFSQSYNPQVIVPMMYRRHKKHEFIPMQPE